MSVKVKYNLCKVLVSEDVLLTEEVYEQLIQLEDEVVESMKSATQQIQNILYHVREGLLDLLTPVARAQGAGLVISTDDYLQAIKPFIELLKEDHGELHRDVNTYVENVIFSNIQTQIVVRIAYNRNIETFELIEHDQKPSPRYNVPVLEHEYLQRGNLLEHETVEDMLLEIYLRVKEKGAIKQCNISQSK